MHPLIHHIVRILGSQELLAPQDTVIVACSGGPDSTALLHILAHCRLDLQLVAVYLDHGLRPRETGDELAFTQNLAEQLGARFVAQRIDVKTYQARHRCSLEEAARTLRFAALEALSTRLGAPRIAVAHTADDQVEEFFLRLIRGTGLKGLSTMDFRHGRVIRPLLATTKEQLLAYLTDQHLGYCVDSTNTDRRFLRNRIRLDLLPDLAARYNPAIRTTILQTAAIIGQDDSLLSTLTEQLYTAICRAEPSTPPSAPPSALQIELSPYRQQHPALQRRLLETICWKMGSRPSFRQIEQMRALLVRSVPGARQHLPNGLRLVLGRESATFSHPFGRTSRRGDPMPAATRPRNIPGPGRYLFPEIDMELDIRTTAGEDPAALDPDQVVASAEAVTFPLTVRPPQPGEVMQPLGAPGRRKISRILSDLKIPAIERARYPLLVSGAEVVAILGLRVAEGFRVTAPAAGQLLISWRPMQRAGA